MKWYEILFTILGSGVITAGVTGLFNYISNKQQNRYNQERYEKIENKEQQNKDAQNKILKTEDLYRIIKQGLKCEYIKNILDRPNNYSNDRFNKLLKELKENHPREGQQKLIIDFFKESEKYEISIYDIPIKNYILNLIDKDVNGDISDFKDRYFIIDKK